MCFSVEAHPTNYKLLYNTHTQIKKEIKKWRKRRDDKIQLFVKFLWFEVFFFFCIFFPLFTLVGIVSSTVSNKIVAKKTKTKLSFATYKKKKEDRIEMQRN